jgi:predicted nucleic acid-binding protein
MDLYKFNPVTNATILENGEFINHVDSVMWVERYYEAGEFEITGQLSSGLREFLPLGTLISHADTMEVMIVENHQIKEQTKEDPAITITGRTLDAFLDHRMVGMTVAAGSSTVAEYILPADLSWNQAVKLINDHLGLNNVVAQSIVTGTGTSELRTINRGSVFAALQSILAVDDLGIKTIRRNPFTGFGGSPTQTILQIHKGVDRTASVIFSWKSGDLDSAEYLFSDKVRKTAALVVGRYIFVIETLGPTQYDRREMIVPADDIDGFLSAPPTGTALTTVQNKMHTRGRQALKSQQRLTISRTDISDVTNYRYRKDFNVGDLVSLDGNFGQIAVMRIVEYAEIEDENGESGHPTLSIPGA